MKTRKLFAAFLSAALTLGVFTACGSPPSASKDDIFTVTPIIKDTAAFDSIQYLAYDGTNVFFIAGKYVEGPPPPESSDPDGDGVIDVMPMPVPRGVAETAVDEPAEEPVDESEPDVTVPLVAAPVEEVADDVAVNDVIVNVVHGVTEYEEQLDEEEIAADEVAADVLDPLPGDVVADVLVTDTTEMVIADSYTYTYDNYTYMVKADLEGNILEQVTLSHQDETSTESRNYNNLFLADDGYLYTFEQTDDYSIDADGNYISSNSYNLLRFDTNLQKSVAVDLNTVILPLLPEDNQWLWVDSYAVDNNTVYMYIQNNIYAVDVNSGALVFQKDYSAETQMYLQGFYVLPDGTLSVVISRYSIDDEGTYTNKVVLAPLDRNTGDFGTEQDFPYSYNITSGDSTYDFYVYDQIGIYGTKLADSSKTMIVNILGSGIGDVSFNSVYPISPTRFVASGYSNENENYTQNVYVIDKVNPADVPEKQLVTVAGLYMDYTAVAFIRQFNKSSTEYQIDFKDYSYGGNSDINTVLTAFNNDIIAGHIPDAVLIDSNLPYDSYVSKGLFMDLTPYLKDDPDLNLDNYYPAFIDALRTENGKLYSLAGGFSIQTLTGKETIFGNEKPGVSFERINEIAAEKNATLFTAYTTRQQFVNDLLFNVIGNYIDSETGECYFNNPGFISLLEAAKTLPEKIDNEQMDWQTVQNALKEDRALLETMWISDFRNPKSNALYDFGEDVSFLGYPNGDGGTGIRATLYGEVAIMQKTLNPDGAWAFVKGLMMYKDPRNKEALTQYGGFPVFTADLEKMALEAKDRPYYRDYETGEKVFYDNIMYVNDVETIIPNNTDADNARIFDLIDGIDGVMRRENALQTIINDDLKAFFSGQKTAAETAAIIQDRASTYIAESR